VDDTKVVVLLAVLFEVVDQFGELDLLELLELAGDALLLLEVVALGQGSRTRTHVLELLGGKLDKVDQLELLEDLSLHQFGVLGADVRLVLLNVLLDLGAVAEEFLLRHEYALEHFVVDERDTVALPAFLPEADLVLVLVAAFPQAISEFLLQVADLERAVAVLDRAAADKAVLVESRSDAVVVVVDHPAVALEDPLHHVAVLGLVVRVDFGLTVHLG